MDAILTVIDDWGQAMDCKRTIIAIFFAKAFDLVDHELLLEKLRLLNFPAWLISWIAAYLSDRKQRGVKIGEVVSEWKDVVTGARSHPLHHLHLGYQQVHTGRCEPRKVRGRHSELHH